MSWRQWTAVGLAIGVGIVLQIPGHDDMEMDDVGQNAMEANSVAAMDMNGPYRMISLDVTGMT